MLPLARAPGKDGRGGPARLENDLSVVPERFGLAAQRHDREPFGGDDRVEVGARVSGPLPGVRMQHHHEGRDREQRARPSSAATSQPSISMTTNAGPDGHRLSASWPG